VSISGGWGYERAALAAALAEYGIGTGGGTTIRLLGQPDASGAADVVVALDGPWGLSSSSATAYVGLYGRGPSSLAALADILAGATLAEGQWPVSVPGLPYDPCPSPR
jgi:beta-N-acetylhexosaminidase